MNMDKLGKYKCLCATGFYFKSTFFLNYINDLPMLMNSAWKHIIFADYTNLLIKSIM